MPNPYLAKPDAAFWSRHYRRAGGHHGYRPVKPTGFSIGPSDPVATAGSCFAQHLSRHIRQAGFRYAVVEDGPATGGAVDENYGVFSARYGNVYTVRQLLQLFERAYGHYRPKVTVWQRQDGLFVDPFRPLIQADGFPSADAVAEDARAHLKAVRELFETASVFIFTLGLTEAWVGDADGAVYPVAPGVAGVEAASSFRNFGHAEVLADLTEFLTKLRVVNPDVRVLLTVSPVPLVATYEDRDAVISTFASKAILRAVCDEVERTSEGRVDYFPSFEIVVAGGYREPNFDADLRSVSEATVARVMDVFSDLYLDVGGRSRESAGGSDRTAVLTLAEVDRLDALRAVVCDEEKIEAAS